MNKVLVLGNDPQINSIRFDQLSPGIKTLGVNRIWLKYFPDYFFFNDMDIARELEQNPETLVHLKQKSTIFSSDWLRREKTNRIPTWVKVYERQNKMLFPDSVSTAISLYRLHYDSRCTFYIAGVALKWQDPSHFWKKDTPLPSGVGHSLDNKWYDPRFEKMEQGFRRLKALGMDLVSVHPNSKLNSFLRYEGIDNLYSR